MTLTEQWKKGELEQGYYYVEEDGKTFISICRKHYLLQVLQDCEVLAPVPSYEEWHELQKRLKDTQNLELGVRKENQQFKELLLDCKQSFRGIRVQIEEFEYSMARKTAQIAIDEIDNAIGENNEQKSIL